MGRGGRLMSWAAPIVIGLGLAGPALAAGPQVVSVAPLAMVGTVGDEDSFRASLRLAAAERTEVFVYASELRPVSGDLVVVPGAAATVQPASAMLGDAPYGDFGIHVTGIREPGRYLTTISIFHRRAGERASDMRRAQYPLQVVAREPVRLGLATADETLTVRRTRCGTGPDCWLAGYLLPAAELSSRQTLLLSNSGRAPVTLTAAIPQLFGSYSGRPLGSSDYGWSEPFPYLVRPGSGQSLALILDPARTAPDRYRGAIYLHVADADGPVVVPVEWTVRDGPLGPLGLLAGGLLLGYLVKFMSERGNALVGAWDELARLRRRIDAATLRPGDALEMQRQVRELEPRLRRGDAEDVLAELANIERRLDSLELATRAEALGRGGALRPRIHDLRLAAYARADDRAAAAALRAAMAGVLIDQKPVAEAVAEEAPPAAARRRLPLGRVAGVLGLLVTFAAVLWIIRPGPDLTSPDPPRGTSGHAITPLDRPPPRPSLVEPVTVVLAGGALTALAYRLTRQRRPSSPRWDRWADARALPALRATRLILTGALFAGLLFVGLKAFYIDEGSLFAAGVVDPVFQYLLWGLGSGVTTRTLGNLLPARTS